MMRVVQGLTCACGLWTVASMSIVAIRGNVLEPWRTTDGSQTMVSGCHTRFARSYTDNP